MDPQELEQLRQKLAELNQTFEGLGTTADKSSLGLAGLSKNLPPAGKAAVEALKGLGNAVSSYNDQMIKGAKGAKVAADSMDKMADGLQNALNVLALIPGLGIGFKIAAVGLGMFAKGISSYNKAAAQQADTLFKTYKDLAKIGAAGTGLQDVFNNLQRAGFGISEIDKFTSALKRNARDLRYFGYSMASGAEGLSEASGLITKSEFGQNLEMLGYELENAVDGMATYTALQGRLGRLQLKTQQDLAKETYEYMLTVDRLARMTGVQAEEQQKAQRSLIEDERWTGFMQEAKNTGEDLSELQNYLGTLPAELRKGAQHIIASGGAISSEEAKRTYQAIPELYQITQELRSGNMTSAQANIRTMDAVRRFSEQTAGSRRVGATEGYGLTLGGEGGLYEQATILENAQKRADQFGMSLEEAVKLEQDRALREKGAKANIVNTIRSQRNYEQQLDAFTNKGLKAATEASLNFALALERGIRAIPGTPVGGRAPTTAGGAPRTAADIRAGRGGGGLNDKIAGAESGGNYSAKNPLSSATGKYQFLKGTFEDLAGKARPGEALYGKTWEDYKSNPAIQEAAMSAFTSQNQSWLQKNGINPTNSATYMAHWFGPGGAVAILKSPPGTQLSSLLGPNVFAQNPNITPGMTVDQLKTIVDNKIGGGYRNGGVASGPTSGYSTTLHGIEAVVPLPDGKTIPVSFNMEEMVTRLANVIRQPSGFNSGSDASNLMAQQISRLDELINQMRNQVNISQKILQYAK